MCVCMYHVVVVVVVVHECVYVPCGVGGVGGA